MPQLPFHPFRSALPESRVTKVGDYAMGPFGLPELLIIFLIIMVLFGAPRLPQLGKGLGEGISNFKRGLKSGDEDSLPEGSEDKKDG